MPWIKSATIYLSLFADSFVARKNRLVSVSEAENVSNSLSAHRLASLAA